MDRMYILQRSDNSAAAFRLLAAVDSYSVSLERLVQGWASDVYAEVAGAYQKVRAAASTVPDAAVAWVSLVISHAELLGGLWSQCQGRPTATLNAAKQRHGSAVAALRRCCLLVLCRT